MKNTKTTSGVEVETILEEKNDNFNLKIQDPNNQQNELVPSSNSFNSFAHVMGQSKQAFNEQEITSNIEKFGVKINDKKFNETEFFSDATHNLTEEDISRLDKDVKQLEENLFKGNAFEVNKNFMLLNMHFSSEVGDDYNKLNKEIAKKTKMDNFSEVGMAINSLNDTIKNVSEQSALPSNIVKRFIRTIRRTKRDYEIEKETIEDKVEIIQGSLEEHRAEQIKFIEMYNEKAANINAFVKRIDEAIYVSRKLLEKVEEQRIVLAKRAQENPTQDFTNDYVDFYDQEKSLRDLLWQFRVVRFDLNTSNARNSVLRSSHKAVYEVISKFIINVIPKLRSQLLTLASENQLEKASSIIRGTYENVKALEIANMQGYKKMVVDSFELSNMSVYSVSTINETIKTMIETEKLMLIKSEEAKAIKKEEERIMLEGERSLREFNLTKIGVNNRAL